MSRSRTRGAFASTTGSSREQRRDHQRERRVLRAARSDLAAQRHATFDPELVHSALHESAQHDARDAGQVGERLDDRGAGRAQQLNDRVGLPGADLQRQIARPLEQRRRLGAQPADRVRARRARRRARGAARGAARARARRARPPGRTAGSRPPGRTARRGRPARSPATSRTRSRDAEARQVLRARPRAPPASTSIATISRVGQLARERGADAARADARARRSAARLQVAPRRAPASRSRAAGSARRASRGSVSDQNSRTPVR